MGRVGITYDQVAAVANNLLALNVNQSDINVRAVLGTGSYATIHSYLKIWKTEHMLVAVEPVDLGNLHKNMNAVCNRSRCCSGILVRVESKSVLASTPGKMKKLASNAKIISSGESVAIADKIETENERFKLLLKINERLNAEIEIERLLTEEARLEVSTLNSMIEVQSAYLVEKMSLILLYEELLGLYSLEVKGKGSDKAYCPHTSHMALGSKWGV